MDKFKTIAKEGWHPEKQGGTSLSGLIGKGKSSTAPSSSSHVARPINTLKDPSSFGAPPKNVNYHGGAAVPDRTTPDTRGLGAPLDPQQVAAHERVQQREEEESARPAPPPVPYRVNTTGLDATSLPKPPRRVTEHEGSPRGGSPIRSAAPIAAGKPKPPSFPPRLPPRGSPSLSVPNTPPPTYNASAQAHTGQTAASDPAQLNQGALNRLGAAGVSVPGLGIGSSNAEAPGHSTSHGPGAMSELQSRFARMNKGGEDTGSASAGSTVQKQAAAKKPPPAPPKRAGLTTSDGEGSAGAPPPVPLSSKPR